MQHIGIDVHKNSCQVCVLTEDGELIERRIKTDGASLHALFNDRPRARILIESSTESEWVARCLEELGHEVIVADPNFAPMYATRSKKVKTDKRDARTLCEACRLGAYRPAHRASDKQRDVRAHLAVRETLVRTRAKYISLIGALARREGCHIKSGASHGFAARVGEAGLPAHVLEQVEPLLAMLGSLNELIKRADEKVAEIVRDDEVVRRLTTVPGVGPVTATTYAATLDGAARFRDAKQVRSYLGLVPREHSSGEKQHRGRISKAGNSRARALLVEAAWALLRWKTEKTRALHEWATRIAERRGKATAVVALARKLAGILFALWRDGTEFDPRHGLAAAGS
ncbi:MAG: IS110 family transposase [Acidobacteriota bacterium]|nr:IS110 family transposase [Acidobacteriota bacterium]